MCFEELQALYDEMEELKDEHYSILKYSPGCEESDYVEEIMSRIIEIQDILRENDFHEIKDKSNDGSSDFDPDNPDWWDK